MPIEKSCGAVIFNRVEQVRYLLLHYEASHWDFVKGHVERNETEKDTVLREVEEESGLMDVVIIEGFRERISYYYRRRGQTVLKEVIFYLLESKTDDVKISGEHVGYEWLDFEKALERLTYKNAKEVLRKANERVAKLLVKH